MLQSGLPGMSTATFPNSLYKCLLSSSLVPGAGAAKSERDIVPRHSDSLPCARLCEIHTHAHLVLQAPPTQCYRVIYHLHRNDSHTSTLLRLTEPENRETRSWVSDLQAEPSVSCAHPKVDRVPQAKGTPHPPTPTEQVAMGRGRQGILVCLLVGSALPLLNW